jgi:hypothetical protein
MEHAQDAICHFFQVVVPGDPKVRKKMALVVRAGLTKGPSRLYHINDVVTKVRGLFPGLELHNQDFVEVFWVVNEEPNMSCFSSFRRKPTSDDYTKAYNRECAQPALWLPHVPCP